MKIHRVLVKQKGKFRDDLFRQPWYGHKGCSKKRDQDCLPKQFLFLKHFHYFFETWGGSRPLLSTFLAMFLILTECRFKIIFLIHILMYYKFNFVEIKWQWSEILTLLSINLLKLISFFDGSNTFYFGIIIVGYFCI